MSLFDKKVLILGAGGFIGRHLVDHLVLKKCSSLQLAGFGVESVFDLPSKQILEGQINAELLNECDEPDIIFHLIGGASVGASIANSRHDFDLTIPPLLNVIDKLKTDWKKTKLIFVSSAAVYGNAASNATTVNTSLEPASPYGLHKKMAEEFIQYYANLYSFNYSIIRPFSVYGPGLRKQLLWDALHKAAEGNTTFFGTGQEMRDWIYVDDLVNLLIAIASPNSQFPCVLNAGTGVAVSVSDILSKLFVAAGYGEKPQFKDEHKKGDPNHLVAALTEQRSVKSFFPTSLDTGLNEYIRWYEKEVS
jgi:UDP-glucose 4-epimerase